MSERPRAARAWRWARRLFPWFALAIACAALFTFQLRAHEFWRDESQALLLGRGTPWDTFFNMMRIEGVTPLFHILLKLASSVLPSPVALSAVATLGYTTLLIGTHRLLLALSGSRRASFLVTVLFATTYTFTYELGVMARQYGGALGLAFLCVAFLRDGLRLQRRRDVLLGALFGALSTFDTPMAGCVAGGGFLAFGLLALLRRGGIRLGWPVLLALPSYALALYLSRPFPARWGIGNIDMHRGLSEVIPISESALIRGAVPVDWWLGAFWDKDPGTLAAWGVLRHWAFVGILAAGIWALLFRMRAIARRPRLELFDLIVIFAAWPPLFEMFANHYWGSYRHMLFLGIPAVVITAGWSIDARIDFRSLKWLSRGWFVLAAPWFALQAGLLFRDLTLDARLPFSETKMAAEVLPDDARVVADTDWILQSFLLWKPGITARSPSGYGRAYTFGVSDNLHDMTVPPRTVVTEECRGAPDRVYYVGGSIDSRCLQNVGHRDLRVSDVAPNLAHQVPNDEQFDVFKVDCACLGVPASPRP